MTNTIIDCPEVEKTKQLIKKATPPITVLARDTEYNRKLLDYGKFDLLLGIENSGEKRRIKNIGSGLNHVLANIASKNKISIGIDLEKLRKMEKKEKALVLEKIRQNIKICRKAKCKISLINYKNKKDSLALLTTLGASTEQLSQAIKQ